MIKTWETVKKSCRHILYYVTAALTFIPYSLCFFAGELGEWYFGVLMRLRRWCLREDYVSLGRRPGER